MVFALFSGAIAALLATAVGGAFYSTSPAITAVILVLGPFAGGGYAYWVLRDREPEPVARIAAAAAFVMATGMLLFTAVAFLRALDQAT